MNKAASQKICADVANAAITIQSAYRGFKTRQKLTKRPDSLPDLNCVPSTRCPIFFRVLRSNLKDAAGRSFGAVRSGVSGIGRIADRGMRNFARATTNGFRRLGGVTYNGVERVGNGAGSRIARVGTAARLGLTRMTDAYRRSFSKAGLGILGVGSAATRGFSNVARTYMRGISRLGTAATRATSRIGDATSVSKRMGEIASDGVSRVAEVANSVPEGISSLASDKKLRDCLLQTMCYVGSPLMTSDRTQRKRFVSFVTTFSWSIVV